MEIGEKIYGFEVKEKKYVREVEGDIIQMEHLSTGAQVVVIDNQDVKRAFWLDFGPYQRTVREFSIFWSILC